MSTLLFEPTIILARCGMTSPTHPIKPPMEIDAAVRIVEHTMTTNLSCLVSIPSALASSSPIDSTFKRQRSKISGIAPTAIGISAQQISDHVIFESVPKSQKVIAGSLSRGSARNFINDTSALASEETKIPERISANAGSRLILLPTRHEHATAIKLMAKANIYTQAAPSPLNIAKAAPKDAPADVPRISGETNGFLKTA